MTGTCDSCGHPGDLPCRGLCPACRASHRRAGTLESFGYVKADRLADFAGMRPGLSVAAAAGRLGVSVRTGFRYEAELRTLTREAAA